MRSFLGWLIASGTLWTLSWAAAAQNATGLPNDTILLNAPVELRCAAEPVVLDPAGFLLALHAGHPDSVREPSPARARPAGKQQTEQPSDALSVLVNVVVYVLDDDRFLPLTLQRKSSQATYLVDCQSPRLSGASPHDFPRLRIKLDTAEDKSHVLTRLKRQTTSAARTGSLAFLLFSGNQPETALMPLPNRGQQDMTYGAMLSAYMANRQEAHFLGPFQGNFAIETLEPEGKRVSLRRITPRPRVVAGNKENLSQATSSTALIGEPLERKQRREIHIGVATKGLAAVDMPADAFNTAGYCLGVKRDLAAPNIYVLEKCLTDDAWQIPLRIRGFEPLIVKVQNQAIQIDALLKSRDYAVPYPPQWQGAASELVLVRGGPVDEVLKRRVVLRQFGLARCEATATPTLADIINETLSFPEPPCGTVDLILPRELLGKWAPTVEGCRPGSSAPAATSAEGVVRCVITSAEKKEATKRVRLAWAAGLDPIELELSTKLGEANALPAADLIRNLRPSLPRPESIQSGPDMPVYRARDVQYYIGDQGCAKAVPAPRNGPAPTLAEAGCRGVPDRVDLTFEIDLQKTDRSVPPEVFKPTVSVSLPLEGGSAANLVLDASRVRFNLPVDFNPERRQRYANQFVRPAELIIAGPKIFVQPGCSDRHEQAKVRFFAKSDRAADFQWPVYGQVFDNEGRTLSDCAKSIVERDADGRLYLTFEFKSTRAAGPRRTIILARSHDLMEKPGLPKALDTAFHRFIGIAHELHKQGAPLSPVDVLSVSQDGMIRWVFSAEGAALEPQMAASHIAQIDRTAPKAPDLSLLRLQPETKGAERILIIMDGSSATQRQVSELRLLGSDLAARKGGILQFFLSSESCVLWQPHAPLLKCVEIGALRQSEREKVLIDALTSFLNPVTGR